ncbi:MAG: RnfABCDGE type electron transport complex subunit G [Bacteroidales bacterium]|nr:RnfABCDGE type electron transport complex subunit G [Bacteroidales bacterium]
MIVSLTVIALVAAAALAALNGVTKDAVAATQKAKVENAVKEVLPAFDRLDEQTIDNHLCRLAYDAEGQFVGAAIEAGNDKGFGGHLQVMVGCKADGSVCGYRILETHETPGLGAKADQWFQQGGKGDIIGQTPSQGALAVKKDGGSVDAISGSTITSRAFLAIINDASDVFGKINQ